MGWERRKFLELGLYGTFAEALIVYGALPVSVVVKLSKPKRCKHLGKVLGESSQTVIALLQKRWALGAKALGRR